MLIDSARARDGLLPLPVVEKSVKELRTHEMCVDVACACGGIPPLPRGRKASPRLRSKPPKSPFHRVLRCFEAVFQKENFAKNRPKNISHVPHEGKGLYNPSGNQRGRREKKGVISVVHHFKVYNSLARRLQ